MMLSPLPTLAFLGNIGPVQWVIIGIVGLLIFGKRLPEVGKSLGKGIVEFKKGLQGIGDEINKGTDADAGTQDSKRLEDPAVHSPRHHSHTDSPAANPPRETTPDPEKSSQA